MPEDKKKRTRISCKISELPEHIKAIVDSLLADPNYSYTEISNIIKENGYEVGRSSVGRYALRMNAVVSRLKDSAEQAKVIVEAAKDDNNIDVIGATNKMLIIELAKKIATSQEEIAEMDIEQAARLAVQLERNSVYKERFKLERDKGYKQALADVKRQIQDELKSKPELLEEMLALVSKVENSITQKLEGDVG